MASTNNYGEEKAQMEEHLQFVAREIGCDWRKLGRKLKIDHNVIECIKVEHTTEEERAYQVLVKWWQDKGFFGATKDILIKALKDIGKTSVAQGIGYRDLSSEDRRENSGQKKPLQQTSSIKSEEPNKSSVTRSSSSPFPTPNSFKFEELTKELGKMLKYCQDSLPSCHRPELGHILKFLEYIQALNEMMLDATDSRTPKKDDEPEIAEMKKAHRARHRETDQTIVLTEHVLTDRMHKSRPVSQILRRCTSTIILPQSRQMCEIVPRCTSIIQLRKASQRKGRPVSEILPQCSSEVELQTAESIPVQDEINADNLADAIQDSKL